MTKQKRKISELLEEVKQALIDDKMMSSTSRALMEEQSQVITELINRLGLNSKNSSKPPSKDGIGDKEGQKKGEKKGSGKKSGGQPGHKGSRLEPVDNPDLIIKLPLDRSTLPEGGTYTTVEPVKKQVFDFEINKIVTEYQAEVVVDEKGKRFVAPFPSGVSQQTQYGPGVKAQVVFDSQKQLIPNMRVAEDMAENVGYPISVGTIHNAIEDAFNRLEPFEAKAKEMLQASKVLHLDETGINVNGKNYWLHGCTSDKWTLLMPHKKRGSDAMDEMGILPHFKNIMVHDHWKPYFKYDTKHCLCNAHHLRELERAFEQDGCKWAQEMKKMLLDANNKKIELEGVMPIELQDSLRQRYRDILKAGEIETPPPPPPPAGKKGRPKRTKARNLLERLRDFETETLRFMTAPEIPFTNNQGERDLRMTKVQLKISGCYRSEIGAMYSARIRSFLSTCKKHNVKEVGALKDLFLGKLPDFVL